MTDKEEIMIDGVNIIDCNDYHVEQETDQVKCDLSGEYCRENKNCFYKQVLRKEQECEELKAYAQAQENQRETYYKEFLRKDKALEEIEGLISGDEFIRCPINDDVNCNYFTRNKILDIINKAKGEEDKQ